MADGMVKGNCADGADRKHVSVLQCIVLQLLELLIMLLLKLLLIQVPLLLLLLLLLAMLLVLLLQLNTTTTAAAVVSDPFSNTILTLAFFLVKY